MIASRLKLVTALLVLASALPALAQPGHDPRLAAITPEAEALAVGLAGEDPADIARYLLARGAESARLSPGGGMIAFRYSATGSPQLWIVDHDQQPRQITFGNGITFFRWTPDGRGLVYGADNDGDELESYFRGSSGFGRTHMTLDDRERRLDSVRNLVDMLSFLRNDLRLDTSRAGVSGQSYGGYMVNAVLAAYPGNFRVGTSRYGVADWTTALETASPLLKASDRIEYGDISEAQWRNFYRENSPIRLADRIRVHVLYSHGINDPRIDISETETMVKALRSNGVEAPYIRFPDEGHGWRKLPNRLFYYRRETEFLEAALFEDQPEASG